jgi:hypothetical protein
MYVIPTNNSTSNLGRQSRVRWIIEPGQDVFLVFDQGWIREALPGSRMQFRAADRGISAKLQYTFRF